MDDPTDPVTHTSLAPANLTTDRTGVVSFKQELPCFSTGINNPKFREWLENRRISPRTILSFQLTPDEISTGILYPVPNSNHLRWKNFDSQAKPKYQWRWEKPAAAKYYHAPDLSDSIQTNAGACWLVSGEADVWALHSAGIEHVLSAGYSESSVPLDLVTDLQYFGVTTLYLAPDRDDTGERWARKVAARLMGSGIELDVRRLPDALGVKADVGRAWQQYIREGWPFERWLLGLPRIDVEPDPATTPQVTRQGDIPLEYRQLVAEALGVKRFGEKGYSQELHCPFHMDDEPSAYLHEMFGLYCFACGQWFTWTKTGGQIGVGTLREYMAAHQTVHDGLPIQLWTEVREVLISHRLTTFSRCLDAIYMVGVQPGSIVTLESLVSSCSEYGFTASFIRRALKLGGDKREEQHPISLQLRPLLSSLQQEDGDNFVKKSGRGRPPQEYRIPSPEEIGSTLKITATHRHYDPITLEGLRNDRRYRAEVMSARPSRRPGCYSRRELSEPLGLTPRTARRYDELAGLEVTPRFEETPLTTTDLMFLPTKRENFYTWLKTESGKTFTPTQDGGARALKTGETVYLVKRLTNHYQRKQDCIGPGIDA
jgi:hypothetical protein